MVEKTERDDPGKAGKPLDEALAESERDKLRKKLKEGLKEGEELSEETADAEGEETVAEKQKERTAEEEADYEYRKRKRIEELEKEEEEAAAQQKKGIKNKVKNYFTTYDRDREKREAKVIGRGIARGVGAAGAVAGTVGAGAIGAAKLGGKGIAGGAKLGYGMAGLAIGAPFAIAGSAFWFFNIAMLLHVVDALTGFGKANSGITGFRFGMYVFLMLYAWFALYGGASQGGLNTLGKPAAISGISFLLPLVVSIILKVITVAGMAKTISALLVFIPLWPVIVAFGMAPPESRYFMAWRIIFIGTWVLAALPTIYNSAAADLNLGESKIAVFEAIKFVGGLIKNTVLGIFSALRSLPGVVTGGVQKQIQYATGDYYTGMVDDNQNEPIGVYLENIQPASSKFFEEDSIVLWGVLRARTLNPDKDVKITTSCYAEKDSEKIKGDADPTGPGDELEISVAVMEEKDLTCEFAPGKLKEGTWLTYFSSTFNFDTHSYLKAYFMDQDRLRATRRQDKDPLDVYGIADKNPVAVFTNGPVFVGIQTTQPLTGPKAGEKNEMRIGVTLENRWQGKIKEIKDLIIKIPPSMSLSFCDYNIKSEPCNGAECEDGKYSVVYRIQEGSEGGKRGKQSLKNIESFQSISCRVNVENVDAALGDVPLVTHYFKVSADYLYELKGETSVTVEKSGG